MSVALRLAASWSAFERAGMLRAATWRDPTGPARSGSVMFDAPGVLVGDGVVTTDYSALFRVSDWPSVRERDVIEIGGVAYRVTQAMLADDGELMRAMLARNG